MVTESDQKSIQYLGLLHLETIGENGPLLGSDEKDISTISIAVVDVSKTKVTFKKTYTISYPSANTPSQKETENEEGSVSVKSTGSNDENENELIGAKPLEDVLIDLEGDLEDFGDSFCFVTDGQLPLRQCLHPQTCMKDITLSSRFEKFFDLRKEFCKKYSKDDLSHWDLLEMGKSLELSDFPKYVEECKLDEMIAISEKMLGDNHEFSKPEIIKIKLEHGICSKNEAVDGNCVVRARGLPWQSSDQDIAKFFRGLNIAKGGVALCLSAQGRRNGEALVRFESEEHRDLSINRHRHHLQNRYIEVYRASGDDFVAVAGGNNNEAQAFLSKGGQVIIRMRGLPYDCTAKQVLEFFDSGENGCSVLDGEDGVLFVKRSDGRATGDAFVLFHSEDDAQKALSKHKESIGTRYIELFRSTTAEVQQVLNRSMVSEPLISAKQQVSSVPPALSEPLTLTPVSQTPPLHINHQLVVSPVVSTVAAAAAAAVAANPPVLPQHMITSGTRKDCIRLRGLPYEAQVEHILEFLGDHAKHIVYQGVHMVYNAQGQPSGEAFIQMDNEASAFLTAQARHNRYMQFFKKQRYIEVFQCSGEDMSMVLTGAPQQSSVTGTIPGGVPASPSIHGTGPKPLTPGLYPSYVYGHHHVIRNQGYGYHPVLYWPSYVSPPLSPAGHHFYHSPSVQQALLPFAPDLKSFDVLPSPHHVGGGRIEYLDRNLLMEKRLPVPVTHDMGLFMA